MTGFFEVRSSMRLDALDVPVVFLEVGNRGTPTTSELARFVVAEALVGALLAFVTGRGRGNRPWLRRFLALLRRCR